MFMPVPDASGVVVRIVASHVLELLADVERQHNLARRGPGSAPSCCKAESVLKATPQPDASVTTKSVKLLGDPAARRQTLYNIREETSDDEGRDRANRRQPPADGAGIVKVHVVRSPDGPQDDVSVIANDVLEICAGLSEDSSQVCLMGLAVVLAAGLKPIAV
jgi:hypothetical protein